jgi:WD40 repeat protein
MQLAVGALNTVSFVDAHAATLLAANAQQHVAPVTALGWTQTAVPLAISAGEDHEAVVWDGQTHLPQVIFQRHTAPIEALTTLSQVVATASEGGIVRVWNALDGQEIHGFFSQTPQALRSAAFSSRGLLAVGGDDGMVRLWTDGRVCAQQERSAFGVQCVDAPHQLRGHTQPVRAVACSPDGTRLATGGDDGSLILWSIESLTPIISQSLPQAITALAWSASGLAAATGHQVMVWQLHRSSKQNTRKGKT